MIQAIAVLAARLHWPANDMTRENYGTAYQRGFGLTLRFLRSRGVPFERALDVSQTAWAKGWERLDQLRDDSLVFTWVNTIALNVQNRLLQNEPTWQGLPESATLPEAGTTSAVDTPPHMNLAAIDMARILKICCPIDRALLKQQLTGLTPREIARMRGVPEGAMRVRLLRARQSARLRLEQLGRCSPALHQAVQ